MTLETRQDRPPVTDEPYPNTVSGVGFYNAGSEGSGTRALNVALIFQGVAAQTACWRCASRRATDT